MQIKVRDLSKRFGKKEALHEVNVTIEEKVYGLLGENGAGKTTLMRCLAGLYAKYDGTIEFDTKDSVLIGYLPQNFDGLGELRVCDFLRYFADMKRLCKGVHGRKKRIDQEIDKVLSAVHLSERKKQKVSSLSGGMRRRLGIAQTLLGDPGLILFDEPTTGLDPKERLRFQTIIAENRGRELIMLISTHIVSDIECLCDEIIVMKEGRVLGVYTPEQLACMTKGKVYEITEEEYEQNRDQVIQVKKIQKADVRKIRVISENVFHGREAESTVEDGYLWMSK